MSATDSRLRAERAATRAPSMLALHEQRAKWTMVVHRIPKRTGLCSGTAHAES